MGFTADAAALVRFATRGPDTADAVSSGFSVLMSNADRKQECAAEFSALKEQLEQGQEQLKDYRRRLREAHDRYITDDQGPSGDLGEWPDLDRYLNEADLLAGNMRSLAAGLLGKILEIEMKCPGDNLTAEQRRVLNENKQKLGGILEIVARAGVSAREAAHADNSNDRRSALERFFSGLGQAAEQFANVVAVALAFVLAIFGIRVPSWNP